MKKTLSITAIIAASFAFGQCNIVGSSNIGVGKSEVYKVDTAGQCTECYHWTSSNASIKLETNKLQTINLKGIIDGTNTLKVSIMTDKGVVECSKIVNVQSSTYNVTSDSQESENVAIMPKCEVDANDFKDLQIDETKVKFIPNGSSNFTYEWKVTYANGQTLDSSEKEPNFQIIKGNDIVLSQVKILSKTCYKILTRAYPLNFWSPPANQRIPQRVYEQVEYSHYSKGN